MLKTFNINSNINRYLCIVQIKYFDYNLNGWLGGDSNGKEKSIGGVGYED